MAGLNALFNRQKIALARARFHAWWEGEEFDEAGALASIEVETQQTPANDTDVEQELFDEPPYQMPGRLVALSLIWGPGRIRPGDKAAEMLEPARIGLPQEGVLAMLGAGLAAPVAALAAAHPGKIELFEWREETAEALRRGLQEAKLDDRVSVTRIDLEAHVFPQNYFDGLFSVDDFAYCGYPPHLAAQILKCLKPGACAVVESYVGAPSPVLATAFASSFAEPQIRPREELAKVFSDTGFAVEGEDDLTEEFLGFARSGFKQLGESLTEAGKLDVTAARELAWEAEAWRMRMTLMTQRRLERRRFILRKPIDGQPDAQPENANAPAG